MDAVERRFGSLGVAVKRLDQRAVFLIGQLAKACSEPGAVMDAIERRSMTLGGAVKYLHRTAVLCMGQLVRTCSKPVMDAVKSTFGSSGIALQHFYQSALQYTGYTVRTNSPRRAVKTDNRTARAGWDQRLCA